MELIGLLVVGGLIYGGYQFVRSVTWDEFSSRQNELIPLKMRDFTDFQRIFGCKGFFLSELNDRIQGPLVVISTADFTRLVAYREFSGDCTDREIEVAAKELSHKWLKETQGFTEEKIQFLDSLTSQATDEDGRNAPSVRTAAEIMSEFGLSDEEFSRQCAAYNFSLGLSGQSTNWNADVDDFARSLNALSENEIEAAKTDFEQAIFNRVILRHVAAKKATEFVERSHDGESL